MTTTDTDTDTELQAAYATGNKSEIIRLAFLVMAKTAAPIKTPSRRLGRPEAFPVGYDFECAILRRDERPNNNHLFD